MEIQTHVHVGKDLVESDPRALCPSQTEAHIYCIAPLYQATCLVGT